MAQELQTAVPGDRITGDELQASVDTLRQMAKDMDALMTDELTVPQMQQIGRLQARLRDLAASLVNRQIELLAGEARVTAEHIDAAVSFANDAIGRIAKLKERLAKIAAVVEFFGAVLTGDGKTIVQAAVTLKRELA